MTVARRRPCLVLLQTGPTNRPPQVYIPEVNMFLCVVCVLLTVMFQTSDKLAAAYGLAVTATFIVTTILLYYVLRHVWRWPVPLACATIIPLFIMDALLFSANARKIFDSGWVPLVIALVCFWVMHSYKWTRTQEREQFVNRQKVEEKLLNRYQLERNALTARSR